jgi:hypothetical protein
VRVVALFTVAICGVLGTGCATVLGIEDPSPDLGDDGGPVPDRLAFVLADVRLAQLQSVRLHVNAVLPDGTMRDVTASAVFSTDNAEVAAATAITAGQVNAGSQTGTATLTASLGTAQPGTVKVTVRQKQCQPVINEFQTGSGTSPDDEWVEILNPCTTSIDVDGWSLVYRSAANTADVPLIATLTGQLAPGEIRLFAGPAYPGPKDGGWAGGVLGQANGGIALRRSTASGSTIADSVAYGAVSMTHLFTEMRAMPAMVNGQAAQRLPFDGRDDDDGAADFTQVTTGSPRAPNAP